MSSVPSYENSCIAPAATGPSEVWLVGVSTTSAGRLDAYIVNLANINTPSARFIATQVDTLSWTGLAPRGCYPFTNTRNDLNSPVVMQQFGTKSYSTNVYPNGTIGEGTFFTNYTFVSPTLFSLSPAVDGINWFAAYSDKRSAATNSRWTGIRWRSTYALEARGSRDNILSVYPTDRPLLSVGTFEPKASGSNSGYHTVFDTDGSGMVYSAVASSVPINETFDRVLTLANPQRVDMNGITLSVRAISITMNNVGYILDRASDDTTMVYSISPSRDMKLRRVGALSDVLPFSSSMVASYMNTQIVVYTPSVQGKAIFNAFDTVTRKWSGPGLVKSQLQVSDDLDDTSSKVPLAAIIGGVVGGLVVIAVAVFLIIRHRRKTRTPGNSAEKVDSGNNNAGTVQNPLPTQQVLMTEGQKIQQSQPQYLAQPQQQFMHQPQPIQQYGQFDIQPQQHPHTVMYPDGQRQSYIYVPPTLVPVPQQHRDTYNPYADPNIPSYSQTAYSPSAPYTPATQTNASVASSPTSPQHPNSFRP
ncbi:MAG: hypothetical protein J3Q66DRAFT_16624 [Benniella sp.]|nr:MAG: hypothetical protein J3Q66DRAFT_16624 [Benniella sp.]